MYLAKFLSVLPKIICPTITKMIKIPLNESMPEKYLFPNIHSPVPIKYLQYMTVQ